MTNRPNPAAVEVGEPADGPRCPDHTVDPKPAATPADQGANRILAVLFVGVLMDHGAWRGVWLALAALQLALVASAFRVGRVAQEQAAARVAGAAA